MLRFFLLIVATALVVIALAFYDYQHFLKQPLALSAEQQDFVINRGWSAKRVSQELADARIIDKPYWFYLYTRLSKRATSIKSGEFILEANSTVPELLETFVKGQTREYSQSIIEGTTFKQLRERLAGDTNLQHDTLNQTDAEVQSALGLNGIHPEGQFFADTYHFPKNASELDVLRRAHAALEAVLNEEWQARAPELGLDSPYEALVLASIVEKETAVAAERPLIAGVFLSRLKKRMRLQTDPTVIYGMGDRYAGNIRRADLTTDTPYNTYTRAGLPPTPISMVGRAAIHAVMHPTNTSALYFVARGDGTHQFSDTNEEHNEAVRKYQLRRRKP